MYFQVKCLPRPGWSLGQVSCLPGDPVEVHGAGQDDHTINYTHLRLNNHTEQPESKKNL